MKGTSDKPSASGRGGELRTASFGTMPAEKPTARGASKPKAKRKAMRSSAAATVLLDDQAKPDGSPWLWVALLVGAGFLFGGRR